MEWIRVFGDNLRDMINASGMSKTEVAYLARISRSALSNYINGTRMPTVKAILNLSYVFDCDVSELMDFGDKVT